MAWAASTVYLHDTADARAVLIHSPVAANVFAIDLTTIQHGPQIAVGSTGRLLAVRSPGRRGAELPDAFEWSALDGALHPRLAALRPQLNGANSRIAPPDTALRWLEDLAARVNGPVSWYQAEADHGDPHAELAWVIDVGGPTHAVFDGEAVSLDRAPALYARQDWRFWRFDASGKRTGKDPLAMALLHLGARLDSPFFLPHSAVFDWRACRLASAETP